MGRKKKKRYYDGVSSSKKVKLDKLEKYSLADYASDIDYITRLKCSESTRSWVEVRMYELRESANIYERRLAEYLLEKKVRFVHQAPFVFYWKTIYFADFFLPDKRLVIEVDGSYHDGVHQSQKDKQREQDFKDNGIRTVRIPNEVARNKEKLEMRLASIL